MPAIFFTVLALAAIYFAGESLKRRDNRLSRGLALAAISTNLATCATWLIAGVVHEKQATARWDALLRDNPGRSLAEFGPGYSLTGAFEGMMMVCSAGLVVASIIAAMNPPLPGPGNTRVMLDEALLFGLASIGAVATAVSVTALAL